MIRSGPADQPPRDGGRGRKRRRSWTDAPQPQWRPAEPPPQPPARPARDGHTRAWSEDDLTSTAHSADAGGPEREAPRWRRPSAPRPVPPWRQEQQEPPQRPDGPTHPMPSRAPHRRAPRETEYETYGDRYPDQYGPPDWDGQTTPYSRPDRRTPPPPPEEPPQPPQRGGLPQYPKKLTVTRVAALRGKQLTNQAVSAFRRAAGADGAEKSGLTSLTYATMLNYASDAAMAVALANTLFFSAASGESKGKVALYLLITVAPFALVAPVIGPMLDRVQRGRRLAMCAASAGQALMCVIMALHFDDWGLYPAALGKMVLSKSFTVLKASITPRVLPPEITLSKTNARLTVFGLAAGAVFGGIGAGLANLFGSAGALWFTVVICAVGAAQALRIPAWVEVTEGEVPASISAHPQRPRRLPMGRHVLVSLWGNGTVRVLTGFLMMFAAFAVRAEYDAEPMWQLLVLGLIAGAAGIGSFAGNAVGARLHIGHPEQVVIGCVVACLAATLLAAAVPGIALAAVVGLVGAVASALAKNSLDAVIQDDLPEASRASAFGRSETVLQLAWVFGGAAGVLLPPIWWLGFLVVSALLAVGLAQTVMTRRGSTLIPGLGGDRPLTPDPDPHPHGPRVAFGEGPPPTRRADP